MKIRATRNIHNTEKTFEQFKLTEFSKSLVEFIPDLSLSCNEFADNEDDNVPIDDSLSFLVKFKADKLNDPRKIKLEGISGIILPEEEGYNYQKEAGDKSFFKTIQDNHFNLLLTEEQIVKMAQDIFSKDESKISHSPKSVSSYFVKNHEKPEWLTLLADGKKNNWKKFLKVILKDEFKSVYCDFKKAELAQMLSTDPEGLKASLLKLNGMGFLEASDQNEIRQAIGADFV